MWTLRADFSSRRNNARTIGVDELLELWISISAIPGSIDMQLASAARWYILKIESEVGHHPRLEIHS